MEDLNELAAELFLDPPEVLRTWADLLLEGRQLIFQGPPGTGKTFIARKLATVVAGHRDGVELVQFHPSYAYEDSSRDTDRNGTEWRSARRLLMALSRH